MSVMSILALTAVCLAALPSVWGHAALVTPVAFNAQPSKSMRCGGVTTGQLNYLPGNGAKTLQWRLIAADGNGPVKMRVDSTGGTNNFPTSYTGASTGTVVEVALTGDTPSVVGQTYTFTYTLPADLQCTGSLAGSSQVCTVQLTSETNWVACFAFTKQAAPVTNTTGGAGQQTYIGACSTVTRAADVPTCSMILGSRVWVPSGSSVPSMDLSVQATLNQNMDNVNVFYAHQDPSLVTPCSTAYLNFLCADTFKRCNAAGTQPLTAVFADQPCQSTCQEFTCWCDLNPLHAQLYRCNYQNADRDVTGLCRRKFGVNNATCVPRYGSSTAGTCSGDLCGAAPHTAAHSPVVLIGAAVALVAAAFAGRN